MEKRAEELGVSLYSLIPDLVNKYYYYNDSKNKEALQEGFEMLIEIITMINYIIYSDTPNYLDFKEKFNIYIENENIGEINSYIILNFDDNLSLNSDLLYDLLEVIYKSSFIEDEDEDDLYIDIDIDGKTQIYEKIKTYVDEIDNKEEESIINILSVLIKENTFEDYLYTETILLLNFINRYIYKLKYSD